MYGSFHTKLIAVPSGEDGLERVIPSDSLKAERAAELKGAIARLRGSADTAMSTAEIMALTRG